MAPKKASKVPSKTEVSPLVKTKAEGKPGVAKSKNKGNSLVSKVKDLKSIGNKTFTLKKPRNKSTKVENENEVPLLVETKTEEDMPVVTKSKKKGKPLVMKVKDPKSISNKKQIIKSSKVENVNNEVPLLVKTKTEKSKPVMAKSKKKPLVMEVKDPKPISSKKQVNKSSKVESENEVPLLVETKTEEDKPVVAKSKKKGKTLVTKVKVPKSISNKKQINKSSKVESENEVPLLVETKTEEVKPVIAKSKKRGNSSVMKVKDEKSVSNKKPRNESTEVESENEVPLLVETKTEEEKPVVAESKKKGKSSPGKVKDLKLISNKTFPLKKPRNKSTKIKPSRPERGVCYFSHIPHGFYKKQLESYCSQFGKVTGVYHPVSKLGNSRGYAFVEFLHKEVAEVVADTMNNYLMFNRLVKCQYVPRERQKPWVFKRTENNEKLATLRRKENLRCQMRNLNRDEVEKWKKRRLAKVNAYHKKLATLGVDYEFQVNDTPVS